MISKWGYVLMPSHISWNERSGSVVARVMTVETGNEK
jgi:hypothetical protein